MAKGGDMNGTLESRDTLGAAAVRMITEELSCLVAVDSGRPRGLVTERELVRGVLCEKHERSDRLDAIPWRPMVAVCEDAAASDAVFLMQSHALRHVPVADGRGSIVGMLAVEDALALMLDEMTELAARILRSAARRRRCARSRRHSVLEAKDVQMPVACLEASASARSVAKHLCATAADLVVVREDARSMGIVTEHDLLRALLVDSSDPGSARAGDLVSRPLVSVTPDEPLERVLAQMADHDLRSVGVSGADGCCQGIVSLGNLLTNLTGVMAVRIALASPAGSS